MKRDDPYLASLVIPVEINAALDHYVNLQLDPGGLCRSLLLNDLDGIYLRVHPLAKHTVDDMIAYTIAYVPPELRGSEEIIDNWIDYGKTI